MGATDEVQVVALQERRHNIRAEGERHASVVLAPANDVLLRVRPQEIAQQAWRHTDTHGAVTLLQLTRAQNGHAVDGPVSGMSVGRGSRLIWSKEPSSGDRPPCMHRIFSSMMAAMGSVLKQSVKIFHSFTL
jgi:hypothetical protein